MPVTIIELHPSQIRFSQDSISYKFQDKYGVEGGDCNDLVNDILRGKITIKDIPNIRVAVINNLYVTYDNRRLYVFRALQYHREHLIIEVRLIQPDRFHEINRLTSENSGKEVRVRYNRSINRARERCRTLPHHRDSWFQRIQPISIRLEGQPLSLMQQINERREAETQELLRQQALQRQAAERQEANNQTEEFWAKMMFFLFILLLCCYYIYMGYMDYLKEVERRRREEEARRAKTRQECVIL